MTSTTRVLREVSADLDAAGLRGWFLVRDLTTGEEVGLEPDTVVPLASVVKVPLALAVLERIADGHLDGAEEVRVAPGASSAVGPVGLTKFRHPATVAVDDLLHLATSLSDSVAADALFDLVDPATVTARLHGLGIAGMSVRHRFGELTETPVEALQPGVGTVGLAHALAAHGGTPGGGHRVPQLDVGRANAGSARDCVDLLEALWRPEGRIEAGAAGGVRALMADNVMRQRLWPDLASDASRWSSKTGTLLNLRHEIGVVEHDDGDTYAIAALTESRVPAAAQPAAEAAMGGVARRLRDHLRG